jgi:hypothetical protein
MLDLLDDVPEENNFHVANGMVVRNLNDLCAILDLIDKKTFKKHVNKEKNDFSSWIRNVYKDHKLADSIKRIRSQKNMLDKVKFYLKQQEEKELFLDIFGLKIEKFWAGLIIGFLFGASLATFIIAMFF